MAELIPREVLFGNPEKVQPDISPDGERLAYLAPLDGVMNVWVGTLGGADFVPVTKDTDRGIQSFGWAHDNRHLLYIQDKGGDENWRVYGVDLESGDVRDFTPYEGVQARILDSDKRFPNELLIGLNRDNEQLHDVYRLDIPSGELTKMAQNPGFLGWLIDSDWNVRGGVTMSPEGGLVTVLGDPAVGDWKPVIQWDAEDSLTSSPIAFTKDGRSLYILSSKDHNAGRLETLDLETGESTAIVSDPKYDVTGVAIHPDTLELQFATIRKERLEHVVLDESVRADLDAIRSLHAGDFSLTGRDDADRTWLVGFSTDDGPVAYYAYDRSTRTGAFLFEHRHELSRYELAKMEPFSFAARDGLEVHGYVTFPPGAERSGLPAVLVVHGGPWARDVWGFDPEAQWLANRGYLCVQVNFRGSTGYGKDFVNAGDREWGAKMHDDLLDAVDWAVKSGFADPARVAISGGSYGGYAALVGATFTPDVFACAVDLCGPSNLKTLIESVPPYWAPQVAMFHRRVGNPESDEEFLWSRSPLSRVEDIRVPLLIVQGANDPRVKQAEADQIVEALKAKGIDHEYVLFAEEGHGLVKPENRLEFYARAERFLAEHLGGRFEE